MSRSGRHAALSLGLLVVYGGAMAQGLPPSSRRTGTEAIGPVTLDYTKGMKFADNSLHVTGNVHLASSTFGGQAETVVVDLQPGEKDKTKFAIARATLEPAAGQQVNGYFENAAQGRNYKFRADHAVYVPDTGRAGGGRINLTGHVQIAVTSPDSLDGPLLTQTETAIVLLGSGPSYPQVETGAGHITFTPLSRGQ